AVFASLQRRDRRATAFVVAATVLVPGLAEFVAKPLVDRTRDGALLYPSAHVTAATTMSLVVLILLERWGRRRLLALAAPVAGAGSCRPAEAAGSRAAGGPRRRSRSGSRGRG